MKRKLIITALLSVSFFATKVLAQQAPLAPDQNPRFHDSANKDRIVADSLNRSQGTTVQNTYKAYDWYQAREERRQQRREWRHQERMYGGYYNYTPGWSVFSGYSPYNNFYGNYGWGGYGNRWGGWGNNWGLGFGYTW